MSEEKTITIRRQQFNLPFKGLKRVVVDHYGVLIARCTTNSEAKAIADALNFQHVTFPAMVAKVQARRMMAAHDVEEWGQEGNREAAHASNIRQTAYDDVLEILEAKNES